MLDIKGLDKQQLKNDLRAALKKNRQHDSNFGTAS